MLNSHSENLDLRSRKSGTKLNNQHIIDDDDTLSSEPQATRKTNTENSPLFDNTQRSDMSTPDKSKSKSHRSSPCKSSTEELSRHNTNGMWRNELPQADVDMADTDAKNEQDDQSQNVLSWNSSRRLNDIVDVILRIVIVITFFKLETTTAFKREIHAEELWLYKNPRRPDIVKGGDLLFLVLAVPFAVTLIFYAFTRDRRDFWAATWAWTLAVCMNGIPTSLLKISVGRPRPDYFYRCFPDGVMVLNETSTAMGIGYLDFICTGNYSDINEGRKSFPSGHSSFAFASFGFLTYYVGAKLHAFDARGRGHTWRLYIASIPLFVALMVAVSRTCDYHHHWQDVVVGGIIGLICGYYSYRQYYPSIFGQDASKPFRRWPKCKNFEIERKEAAGGDASKFPLLGGKQQDKWY